MELDKMHTVTDLLAPDCDLIVIHFSALQNDAQMDFALQSPSNRNWLCMICKYTQPSTFMLPAPTVLNHFWHHATPWHVSLKCYTQ